MARLELSNKINKRSGIRITPIDPNERIGITPLEWSRELLKEQLNQFIGEPNTEVTKNFPRKPTAFRRGMNWKKLFNFFLIFNNFSIHRNIYCYFVTINIADYDFIQIQTIQN